MKQLYKSAVYGCALLWLAAVPADIRVPVATDLQQEGARASEQRLPILLVFSAEECDYCELLDEEFLQPMLLGGEYTDAIIIRKLLLDNGSRVRDFAGKVLDVTQLADGYRVYVTPTLLFVDSNGRELTQRMIGINTLALYGGYLDDCIATALAVTRNPATGIPATWCSLQGSSPLKPAVP